MIIIKCKIESIAVSKKDCPRCELHIGNVKIKQGQEFIRLFTVVTDKRKCEKEIQRCLAKDTFQKLNKVLTD